MNTIKYLAPYFEHYITIEGLEEGEIYSYRGAEWQMVQHTRHLPKCKKGESWMYIAVDQGADLEDLQDGQLLYIGSQTQDRMFRGNDLDGNGLGGINYHHAEMRKGRGHGRNLISHLEMGRMVDIYRISGVDIEDAVADSDVLMPYLELMLSEEKHPGYWLEQIILDKTFHQWQWNSKGAERVFYARCNQLGIDDAA